MDSRDPVDLSRCVEPDLGIVDLLARATLEARGRGDVLVCRGTAASLIDFLAFCGLEAVVDLGPDPGTLLRVEPRG
jgi:hypothetical protein